VVDYDFIFHGVVEDSRTFSFAELAYDRWQADALTRRLEEALPHMALIPHDQRWRTGS
jgi:hypothetical protein